MGIREQSHAKKTSPGYAINRYAKKPDGTQRPRPAAPSVSKQAPEPEPKSKPKPDTEQEKPKKSKLKAKAKPPSTEIALSPAQSRQIKQLDNLAERTKKVGTVFGIKKSEIMEAVENGDIDNALSIFRRRAYMTIVNLIPIAEKEYTRGKRDHQAYVLNALITQGRELAADLLADGDRSQLVGRLIAEMLEPAFKGIMQNIVSEMQQTKLMLSDKVVAEHKAGVSIELDQVSRRLAAKMNEMFVVSCTQLRRALIGE